MLRDKFVVGLRDQKLQRTLMSISTLTWDKAVKDACSYEAACKESSQIHNKSVDQVNKVNSKDKFKGGGKTGDKNDQNSTGSGKVPCGYS